jgi:type I site-specific restriction-modification system R (restriction) subunit
VLILYVEDLIRDFLKDDILPLIIKDFVVFRNDAREGLINYEIYNN